MCLDEGLICKKEHNVHFVLKGEPIPKRLTLQEEEEEKIRKTKERAERDRERRRNEAFERSLKNKRVIGQGDRKYFSDEKPKAAGGFSTVEGAKAEMAAAERMAEEADARKASEKHAQEKVADEVKLSAAMESTKARPPPSATHLTPRHPRAAPPRPDSRLPLLGQVEEAPSSMAAATGAPSKVAPEKADPAAAAAYVELSAKTGGLCDID